MNKPNFKVVLVNPEIPGNTGSIGRTCVALGLELILIKPYGFDISEKAVRRAGLDYWKHLNLTEYDTWKDFIDERNPQSLLFFENHSEKSFYSAPYDSNSYFVFGCETQGLPVELVDQYRDQTYLLPMFSEHIRSLNLSNTVTATLYCGLGVIQNQAFRP
ncbi:MAG: tRNA (cytidine(34)-2'-O)-methyltransferase [Halobacteriovoraceae bacterium]|nr:tRNA (cytidine(34)-2'-O)-methyltransferase [Halobacteriovoraceae bacterium]MCB9095961.1 tRNA (cytidine(34)-2'-O)-methyltransferase [Halobacteriovoraceae bacterium]